MELKWSLMLLLLSGKRNLCGLNRVPGKDCVIKMKKLS